MERRLTFFLGLFLVLATLAVYWPATRYDFVVMDDDLYVTENPWVMQRLSVDGVKWAFTTVHAANWHPLTWISHMIDYSVYGLFAGGHHLTNILLHTLNTLLLFLLLKRLTGTLWSGAVVAALFGLHPLHVESVVWVSERKDVLSTLFMLLTVWAYSQYVKTRTKKSYGLTLVLFALGLMAKPMLVTLPCVLLLLDYWPFERLDISAKALGGSTAIKTFLKLGFEKAPFFALSLAACIATIFAQRAGGAIKTFDSVPFFIRVLNSLSAYGDYIGKTFFPVNLCIFYPLPTEPPVVSGIVSALFLALLSYLVFRWRNKYPWMLVGWLWFLGTLVPVIGLIQVGQQAMADRYTYIPHIGLFIAMVWCVKHWIGSRRTIGFGLAIVTLVACLLITRNQIAYWRDSIALFTHGIAVAKDNALSRQNLGVALSQAGKSYEAIEQYEKALRLKPDSARTHYNLGIEWFALEKFDQAEFHFFAALKAGSRSEKVYNNLGILLAKRRQLDSAKDHFRRAIQQNPIYPKPYLNYAVVFQQQGFAGPAVTNYATALSLEPNWPEALSKYAYLLATCSEPGWRNPIAAIKLAERANEITRSEVPAYLETLAIAYAEAGKFSNAVSAAELAQKNAAQTKNLQLLRERLGRDIESYRAGKAPQRDWKNPL
jgi:protein O-mannosyl-transferase